MKFERLTPPDWQLPDLVAFNERVHEWVDPWWAYRWVRLVAWATAALFVLFAAMWIYFASGLPSAQSLLAYKPPLPANVRGYNGDPVQTFARERRVDLSYDEIPPLVVHAFISAEDKDFFHRNGYITEDQWHNSAVSPLGTIRYGSNEKFTQQGGFFMEEVRRELIKRFGEDSKDGANSLYSG